MLLDVNGLTNEAIAARFPAVFAQTPHTSCSDRYLMIPTMKIIDAIRAEGLAPTCVMAAKTRSQDRVPYAKHLIRFRSCTDLGSRSPEVREVLLVNSHDASSSYRITFGVFRLVCSNGLITGDIAQTLAIRHTGDDLPQIVEGTLRVIEESDEVMDTVHAMKSLPLSRPEQVLLAEHALAERYALPAPGGIPDLSQTIYRPEDLLGLHRDEDRDPSLWTTMNVIQENAMGGVTRVSASGEVTRSSTVSRRDARGVRRRMKSIGGIDQTIEFNQRLWMFSKRLLETKS